MYQCIGQKRIRNREGERTELIRCKNESETPSILSRPEYGFLCADCANTPSVRNSPRTEAVNVSAMQSDPREYKDQMESGFMTGIRGSDRTEEEGE